MFSFGIYSTEGEDKSIASNRGDGNNQSDEKFSDAYNENFSSYKESAMGCQSFHKAVRKLNLKSYKLTGWNIVPRT